MIPANIISSDNHSKVNDIKLTGRAIAIVPDANHARVADIQAVLNKLPKSAEVISIDLEVVNHPGEKSMIDVQITVEYESTESVTSSLTDPVLRDTDTLQGVRSGSTTTCTKSR